MGLVACPFCRELFPEGEAEKCPVCGVDLTKADKLPPSLDQLSDDGVPVDPAHDRFAFTYLGRNRGALLACAAIGLVLFFLPWAAVSIVGVEDTPTIFSGVGVAREFGWPWAIPVAWFVLLPTLLSRRTIWQLRTARVAAAMMAAIPAVSVVVLLAHTPTKHEFAQRVLEWQWPVTATLLVSLAAFVFALRLGGRIEDIKVKRGSSVGHTVH